MAIKSPSLRKLVSLLLTFTFLFTQTGFAQVAAVELNIGSHLGILGSKLSSPDKLRLPHLRYFSYDNQNNNIQLLLDKGDLKDLKDQALEDSGKELLKYFLIGVTLPDEHFWVNLRPDSEENIIPELLAKTDIGKIFLEADVQLKKDTASLTSPNSPQGKLYWDKLYKKAAQIYGTQNVTIPTLTRPWIVPNEIIIRESKESAYIYKATLKVMLEQDHLKGSVNYNFEDSRAKELNEYSSELIRELILPELTKEVNNAKRYSQLRQVYYSLILARWFKARFYGKGGLYASYINKANLEGLTSNQSWSKDTYFKAYQSSFKDGEYNLQATVNTISGPSIRSYFSGGMEFGPNMNIVTQNRSSVPMIAGFQGKLSSPMLINVGMNNGMSLLVGAPTIKNPIMLMQGVGSSPVDEEPKIPNINPEDGRIPDPEPTENENPGDEPEINYNDHSYDDQEAPEKDEEVGSSPLTTEEIKNNAKAALEKLVKDNKDSQLIREVSGIVLNDRARNITSRIFKKISPNTASSYDKKMKILHLLETVRRSPVHSDLKAGCAEAAYYIKERDDLEFLKWRGNTEVFGPEHRIIAKMAVLFKTRKDDERSKIAQEIIDLDNSTHYESYQVDSMAKFKTLFYSVQYLFSEDFAAASSPFKVEPVSSLKVYSDINQRIWLDGLTFEMLLSGEFEKLVREHGINGVTTNPSLIKAYFSDQRVIDKARKLASEGLGKKEIYYQLVSELARTALEIFKKAGVANAKFSVELDPTVNNSSVEEAVVEAMQWTDIDPAHMMVKVALTSDANGVDTETGYKIIEEVISRGRNVNVTLIFTPEHYKKVVQAYINGLKRALLNVKAGKLSKEEFNRIYSVASFFISRWDVYFEENKLLADGVHGKAANSIAIEAYNEIFKFFFSDENPEWKQLKDDAASIGCEVRPQEFLLASTGSKGPDMLKKGVIDEKTAAEYPAGIYVHPLQGSYVVNTLPYGTIKHLIEKGVAKNEDGSIAQTIESGYIASQDVMDWLRDASSITDVGAILLKNATTAFLKDFADIQNTLEGLVSGKTSSPVNELQRADVNRMVDDLLGMYKAKDEVVRIEKLEGIIRPAAKAIEEYLYGQFADQKIAANIYEKGMKNIIPNLAKWYTDPYIQESTVLGIEDAVKEGYWKFIAQAYMAKIAYGTAGVRGKFAFGKYFQLVAEAAKQGKGLRVPNLKGPNTFNDEIVRQFTLGVLKFLENQNSDLPKSGLKLFTAYDSRVAGKEFAQIIRDIGLAYGVQVYISDEAMPLPEFSNSLKELSGGKAAIGIYISASHNVKPDNGVKLIGADGMQLGANDVLRKAVMKEFDSATLKEVAELLKNLPSEIPAEQLTFIGGKEEEKLPGVEYGDHKLIDTHTMHFNAVLKHVKDQEAVKKYAKDINILYCAFHGAGRRAAPRVLGALGFNVEKIEKMDALDGTLPEFADAEPPDPALVASWKKALQAYLSEHRREDLLKKDLFSSNDPDADRYGGVIRVSAAEIPEDEAVAEAMGIAFKLTEEEQAKYGYGGFRVLPPNEWNALIAFYDLKRLKDQGKLDPNKHVLVFSHVTSYLMKKIADYFGIAVVIKPVGVDQLADEIVKLEKQGKIAVNGAEESGTYMTSDHIRDKDGFLAGVRLAEIACAARAQGKTINDLLNEIYLIPEIGFFATTNFPIEYEVSVPGTAAKMAAVKFLQKDVKPLVEERIRKGDNPVIAGYKIHDVDEQTEFRSGKYDEPLEYQGYPDAGIRFYFNPEKTGFITDRPSGTGPQLRFYAHLFYLTEGLDLAGLNTLKKNAYAECLKVTKEWMRITQSNDIKALVSSPVVNSRQIAKVLSEMKKNSGLPISIAPSLTATTWSGALHAINFSRPVFRRVERESLNEERFTGKTAFTSAASDTDVKGLTTYDVIAGEFKSVRTGEQVRGFITDQTAALPEYTYFMHRGIFASREDIQKAFYDNKIRFDITVIPPGIWGIDYAKTVGHYHKPIEMPEIYQVVSGDVLWLMQKLDKNGNVEDFVTVRAKAGDIAIMLPGYGHVSVNLSETAPLVLANWLTWNQSSEYGSFKDKGGAAYYVVKNGDGQPELRPNPKYVVAQGTLPEPRQMVAKDGIEVFGLKRGEPIYNLVKLDAEDFANKIDHLNNPANYDKELTVEATLDKANPGDRITSSSPVKDIKFEGKNAFISGEDIAALKEGRKHIEVGINGQQLITITGIASLKPQVIAAQTADYEIRQRATTDSHEAVLFNFKKKQGDDGNYHAVKVAYQAIQGGQLVISFWELGRNNQYYGRIVSASSPVRKSKDELEEYEVSKGRTDDDAGSEIEPEEVTDDADLYPNMPGEDKDSDEDSSSPLDKKGGIDFRSLPLTIQPAGSFKELTFSLPPAKQLASINISKELVEIKNMVDKGIAPSGERVKDLVAACYQKNELASHQEELISCLMRICKLQEDLVLPVDNSLKEAIVIVDSLNIAYAH
ncbi:MAG: transaldolase family protein [Candidatus Omnitrophota bacterium]